MVLNLMLAEAFLVLIYIGLKGPYSPGHGQVSGHCSIITPLKAIFNSIVGIEIRRIGFLCSPAGSL